MAVYDYEYFKKEIFDLTKIDLHAYKEKQMKRRIDTLISKNNVDGYENYLKLLKKDETKYEEFINYLTINVSEFYRNPEQWDFLDKVVFPDLIGKFGQNLKIWSAACSTGDEPYSLVMCLSRHVPLSRIKIQATDIDKQVLAKAALGLYSKKSIAAVPEDFKEKYFTKISVNSFQISEDIKKCVEFSQHNLLKDEYPADCHLIVCRNVLIYFTEDAKDQVFRNFSRSIKDGGCLFIGSTEQIINYRDMGFFRQNSFFYGKGK